MIFGISLFLPVLIDGQVIEIFEIDPRDFQQIHVFFNYASSGLFIDGTPFLPLPMAETLMLGVKTFKNAGDAFVTKRY